MPRTSSRLEFRQMLPVNLGLLALLVLLSTTVTAIYTSSERNFHWWIDWYYNTIEVATAFRESPMAGIKDVLQSLANERNKIYTLPLIPFILTFGESRLIYQLGMVVYLLPFSLSMGALATYLIQANPYLVFWSSALLSLLIPVNWVATFLGIPDTGSAALIALASCIYLHDVKLKRLWRIPVIGFVLALAILWRRHFVYGAIAFLCAVTLQTVIFLCFESKKIACNVSIRRTLQVVGVKISLIAMTCFATLTAVAWEFTHRAIVTDYRNLYASWSLPFDNIISLYAAYYGWATLLLVAIGFSAGILTHVLSLPAFSFIWLFGIFSLIEWFVILRYGNIFYSLHLTSLVVMGLAAFLWTAYLSLRGKARTLILGASICFLVGNLVIGLTPLGSFTHTLRPLLALNIPPLVRTDYDEVVRLVEYLHKLTHNKEPIYIVGFQRLHLNGSMIRAAERILYRQKNDNLLILKAPQVDSQDFYPLERLLQAQYVVIPNPLPNYRGDFTQVSAVGEWLPLKEHDVVKVVFDAFIQNWKIAQDFKPLPVQFTLADGAVVNIYQRIRPTSLETAVQTLTAMQQRIGERPGAQLDWIGLTQHWNNYSVTKNLGNTYKLLAYQIEQGNTQTITFLYLGSLSNRTKITGKATFFKNSCIEVSLKLALLNQEGRIVGKTKQKNVSPISSEFQFSISSKEAAYLLLNIASEQRNNSIKTCTLKIDFLSVAPQK